MMTEEFGTNCIGKESLDLRTPTIKFVEESTADFCVAGAAD